MDWNGGADYWIGVLECHAHKLVICCRGHYPAPFLTLLSWLSSSHYPTNKLIWAAMTETCYKSPRNFASAVSLALVAHNSSQL